MSTEAPITRKRFGQHFLHDPAVVSRIVDVFNPQTDQHIVEIGPGLGVLTRELVARIDQTIDVVELDRDLAARLRNDSLLASRLNVHQADALKFDFDSLHTDSALGLRIIGNLPYMISTPLLFRFTALPRVTDMLFMLQKEVVERIVAQPDSRTYGRLGIMLSAWFDAQHMFDVGAGAFKPPPKVNSAIVHLRPREGGPLDVGDPKIYADLVRQAFSARRKTLRNALTGLIDANSLQSLDIDPSRRPQTLTDQEFACIARFIVSTRVK